MYTPPNLTVVVASQQPLTETTNNDAEIPNSIKKLTPRERKVWQHVTQSLKTHGLIHSTDAMVLNVIVTTFCRWIDTEEQLEKYIKEHDGSYLCITPNGYEQPHQLFYAARHLKRDLLQWLPEACLTIPSFRKAKNLMGQPQQADLFKGDSLTSFVGSKPRLVGG